MEKRKFLSGLLKWKLRALLLTLTGFGLGTMVSAHGGDITKIHSCVNNESGEVRIVNASVSCRGNETALDWNITGPTGPQGPSTDAFATFQELGDSRGPISVPPATFVTVGSLNLPAGSYVVTASLFFVNDSMNPNPAIAYCLLLIGSRNAQTEDTVPPPGARVGAAVSQALTVADQLVGPGIATLRCTNNGFGNLSIATFNINAIKLGTLTFQP